eukprot:1077261_1
MSKNEKVQRTRIDTSFPPPSQNSSRLYGILLPFSSSSYSLSHLFLFDCDSVLPLSFASCFEFIHQKQCYPMPIIDSHCLDDAVFCFFNDKSHAILPFMSYIGFLLFSVQYFVETAVLLIVGVAVNDHFRFFLLLVTQICPLNSSLVLLAMLLK